MSFYKFRNQNHYPKLLDALKRALIKILSDHYELKLQSHKVTEQNFPGFRIDIHEQQFKESMDKVRSVSKLLDERLNPEELDFAFHEHTTIEVWVMGYKLRERWSVMLPNERAKYPTDTFYKSGLAAPFRPDRDDDSTYQEFERFFASPSVKISERLIRPLILECGIDVGKHELVLRCIEGQIREVLMAHWMFLYLTVDDDLTFSQVSDSRPKWII